MMTRVAHGSTINMHRFHGKKVSANRSIPTPMAIGNVFGGIHVNDKGPGFSLIAKPLRGALPAAGERPLAAPRFRTRNLGHQLEFPLYKEGPVKRPQRVIRLYEIT